MAKYVMSRDFTPTLGARLLAARTAAKRTQLDVAAEMQCTINSVSNWERGNTDIKVVDLCRFAKACGTTPAALLEGL